MRTTIRLSDALLDEAKLAAAESGSTLTALIEEALRESLARRKMASSAQPVRLPVEHGQGTYPGVRLDSNAELLDWMERHPHGPG